MYSVFQGSLDRPLQALYGHNSEVLCADISTELNLAVSGSKDGTCILHTVRHGRYLNTLQPRKGKRCEVQHVALSGYGILIFYTEDTTMRHRVGVDQKTSLHKKNTIRFSSKDIHLLSSLYKKILPLILGGLISLL